MIQSDTSMIQSDTGFDSVWYWLYFSLILVIQFDTGYDSVWY